MKIVMDASAACEIVLRRPRNRDFSDCLRNATVVQVPDLFVSEVANVMWKYVRFKEIEITDAQGHLEDALKLCDQVVDASQLVEEALVLACQSKHPVYDCLYVVLARRNSACILSTDKKLNALSQANGVRLAV